MLEETRGITLHEITEKILAVKQEAHERFLTLGKYLYAVRESRIYEDAYETFSDYVESIGENKTTASQWASIYEKFIYELEYKPKELLDVSRERGWTNLADILPVVSSKETAEEWLHKAKYLRRPDLRKEVHEAKTGIIARECSHESTYTITHCSHCRESWRTG